MLVIQFFSFLLFLPSLSNFSKPSSTISKLKSATKKNSFLSSQLSNQNSFIEFKKNFGLKKHMFFSEDIQNIIKEGFWSQHDIHIRSSCNKKNTISRNFLLKKNCIIHSQLFYMVIKNPSTVFPIYIQNNKYHLLLPRLTLLLPLVEQEKYISDDSSKILFLHKIE